MPDRHRPHREAHCRRAGSAAGGCVNESSASVSRRVSANGSVRLNGDSFILAPSSESTPTDEIRRRATSWRSSTHGVSLSWRKTYVDRTDSKHIMTRPSIISYCRPLGLRTLLCPEQDPGLDKQLQIKISNINIKQCKYIQLVTTSTAAEQGSRLGRHLESCMQTGCNWSHCSAGLK